MSEVVGGWGLPLITARDLAGEDPFDLAFRKSVWSQSGREAVLRQIAEPVMTAKC